MLEVRSSDGRPRISAKDNEGMGDGNERDSSFEIVIANPQRCRCIATSLRLGVIRYGGRRFRTAVRAGSGFDWNPRKREIKFSRTAGHRFRGLNSAYSTADHFCSSFRSTWRDAGIIVFGLPRRLEVVFVFTIRGESCWLISARRARRDERKKYYDRLARRCHGRDKTDLGKLLRPQPTRKSRRRSATIRIRSISISTGPRPSSSSRRKRRRSRSASTRTCSIISRKKAPAISAASTRCCAPTCSRNARSALDPAIGRPRLPPALPTKMKGAGGATGALYTIFWRFGQPPRQDTLNATMHTAQTIAQIGKRSTQIVTPANKARPQRQKSDRNTGKYLRRRVGRRCIAVRSGSRPAGPHRP